MVNHGKPNIKPITYYHQSITHITSLSPSPSPGASYPYYHPPGFFVQVAGSGWTRTAWTLRCQNPRPRDCPRAEFPGTRTSFSPMEPMGPRTLAATMVCPWANTLADINPCYPIPERFFQWWIDPWWLSWSVPPSPLLGTSTTIPIYSPSQKLDTFYLTDFPLLDMANLGQLPCQEVYK